MIGVTWDEHVKFVVLATEIHKRHRQELNDFLQPYARYRVGQRVRYRSPHGTGPFEVGTISALRMHTCRHMSKDFMERHPFGDFDLEYEISNIVGTSNWSHLVNDSSIYEVLTPENE